MTINYSDFKNEWLGKGCNPNNLDPYGNQCVMVFYEYCKEVLGITVPIVDAIKYWDTNTPPQFEKIVNTPTTFPQQGDTIIWRIGDHGHIAECDVADLNQLTSLEQNWRESGTPNDGKGVVELRQHGYNGVVGWLRPIINSTPTMTQDQQNSLNFIIANNITEGQVRQGYGYITSNIEKTVSDLKIQVDTLTTSNTKLSGDLAIANKSNSDLQIQINKLQGNITDLNGVNNKLQNQINNMTITQIPITWNGLGILLKKLLGIN